MAIFQSPKIFFSEAEMCKKIAQIQPKERFFARFQAQKFRARKNASPYPQSFHTPTRLPLITPPITPNKFRGFSKRNSQEQLHHPVLSLLGKLHSLLHQNILREFIGVINVTSVTPENSWGINCVIPMVLPIQKYTTYIRTIVEPL